MKRLMASILFTCAWTGPASADSTEVQNRDPATVDAIKQISQDMGDAMVAVDIDRLNRIFADDWSTVGSSGQVVTKETVLSDFRSGKDRLEAFELGPIDVQVFGNVAAAHGTTTEIRSRDGRDVSGQFVWMDLLEKRAGRWVVVRSAGARVK